VVRRVITNGKGYYSKPTLDCQTLFLSSTKPGLTEDRAKDKINFAISCSGKIFGNYV
jgi:hypothetical protein